MTNTKLYVCVINKETHDSKCVLVTESASVPRVGEGFLFQEIADAGVFIVNNIVWFSDASGNGLAAEITLAGSVTSEVIARIQNVTGVR